MEADLDDSGFSNDGSRQENLMGAISSASARAQERLLSEYQDVMQVASKTRLFSPDMQQKGWRLGRGGCFTTIERYYENGTNKVVAVKKMSDKYTVEYEDYLGYESVALSKTMRGDIPRVVKWIDWGRCGRCTECLVLELVEGSNLSKHIPTESQESPANEAWMLQVAAQLVDTLFWLHCACNICHLDLSPDNVMLLLDKSNPWNTLKLIDFGLARGFNAGARPVVVDVSIKDVKPTGATSPYASPEVLRSLMLQFEGAKDDEEGVMINGCLADMWSLGCMMYEMLTGDKPFLPEDDSFLSRQAPSYVPSIFHSQWLMFDAFAEAQRDWLEAIEAGMDADAYAHPLLDRIADCSVNSHDATKFFVELWWPVADERLGSLARFHEYIVGVYESLKASAPNMGLRGNSAWRQPERMEQPARPTASRQSGPAAAQEAVTSVGGGPQQPEQPEEAQLAEAAVVTQSADYAEDPEAAGHAEHAEKGGAALERSGSVFTSQDESMSDSGYQSCDSDGDSGAQSDYESNAESRSSYGSVFNSESESDDECEAESSAVVELVHIPRLFRSAPLPASIKLNSQAGAQFIHTDQPLLIPCHRPWPVSSDSHAQQDDNLECAQNDGAAGGTAVDLHPTLDIAKQPGSASVNVETAGDARSSNDLLVDGLSASEAMSEGQNAECHQSAPQQAAAVDTSEHACLSASLKRMGSAEPAAVHLMAATPIAAIDEAAGDGASLGDRQQPSSRKRQALQKLKKALARKLRPGKREADSVKQDKGMRGQQVAAATEQAVQDSSPAMHGKLESSGKHGAVQKLKGRAGRCLQKVMPACMKPPPVHSTHPPGRTDVQPLTAVARSRAGQANRGSDSKAIQDLQAAAASDQVHVVAATRTVSKQQQGRANAQRQGLSKFTGLFKLKKAASKQAMSGSPAEALATELGREPSNLIAAVSQPHDLAQQARMTGGITAAAGKPASQPPKHTPKAN